MGREVFLPGAGGRRRRPSTGLLDEQTRAVYDMLRSYGWSGVQPGRESGGIPRRRVNAFGAALAVPLEIPPLGPFNPREAKPTLVHDTKMDTSKLTKNGDIPTTVTVSDV